MLVDRTDFLPKPYTDTQLLEALAALLSSSIKVGSIPGFP